MIQYERLRVEVIHSTTKTHEEKTRNRKEQSRFDNRNRKKRIDASAIREIIKDAFHLFLDQEVSDERLAGFEESVCKNSFSMIPEEAA